MLRAALLAAAIALPGAAQAIVLLPDHVVGADRARITGFIPSDSGEGAIFRGDGRLVPGYAPGFIGDDVYGSDGRFFGSVDEVYLGPGHVRWLVIGLARSLAPPDAETFLYVRLPVDVASDGQIFLPADVETMRRLAH